MELNAGLRDSRDRLGLAEPFDLGVLLVHGIGEQQRGDTLAEEGDRIFRWLRRRVVGPGDNGGAVDVLDVVMRQPSEDELTASHAVVRITPPGGLAAHWVVAESWWADAFRPATFGELVGWGLTIGPWVFATQVAAIYRRMEIGTSVPPSLRALLIPIALLVGLVFAAGAALLSFAITALAVVVIVVAMTRIPFLSDLARGLQGGLANGFGDAYVLTRSPMRFGAMATQVRYDLQALLRACRAVAVVAHSQGTATGWWAIKHEVLDRRPGSGGELPSLGPLRLFVTYGQGLRKLAFVLTMARGEQSAVHALLGLACAVLFGLALWAFFGLEAPVLGIGLGIGAVAAELALLRLGRPIWDASGAALSADWAKVSAAVTKLHWLDLWASADPAPVGPLDVNDPPGTHPARIRSYKIRSMASFLLDHFVYWWNTTEFLPIVASCLFALGGPPPYAAELDDPRLEVTALRRHARVLALMSARVVVWGGVAAGLLYAWLTPGFGTGLMEWVAGLDLPFVAGFFDDPPDWAVAVAGYLAVLLAGAIAWLPVSAAWNGLVGADEATYFGGRRRPLWSAGWAGFAVLVLVIGGGIKAAFLLAGEPALGIGYAVGALFVALLGNVILASGGVTFAGAEATVSARAATAGITGSMASGGALVLALAAVLVAVPVVAAVAAPAALGWVLVAELLAASVVLAVEGVREYRVFQRHFDERNALLPED
jgi:hypothetical protein